MKPLLPLLLLALVACQRPQADQQTPQLHFNDQGRFRIAQFTDLHCKPFDATTDTTFATIRAVVERERPDLAVLTGDVVCYDPATDGWQQVIGLFEELNLPFTVTLGNHDAEYLTKDSIYNILLKSPLYVGEKGSSELHGMGNCVVEVKNAEGNTGAAVYMIDSNDYQPVQKFGHYDWIHLDQINWYRDTSARLTKANNDTPVPAVAFFHIPVQEFAEILDDDKTFGNRHEGGGAPAKLNSGFFAAAAEAADIMGIFVGHDHDNDFVGINRETALGFGRCTGAEAYGRLTRGARIIDLFDGNRKFETYIATPEGREPIWYYPSGLNAEEQATMDYLPAVAHDDTLHGVNYIYYEGLIKHTTQIADHMEAGRGSMPNFDITDAPADDHFAYRFIGRIKIPATGVYRFYTYSDDGSVLKIDGVTVIDNDGGHSARRREGKVALEGGFHDFTLDYFENYMGQQLEVGFTSREIPETLLPDSLLYVNRPLTPSSILR